MFSVSYTILMKNRFSRVAKAVKKDTNKMGTAARKAAAKTKALAKSLEKLRKKGKQVARQMKSLGRSLSLRMTMPIIGLGVASVMTFAKLEKGLVNVNNLLTKDELGKYAGKLKLMQDEALRAGYAIADTNKGLFDTVSALGANEKAFETFTWAQKLARGGNTELGTAVHGLTSLMNTYKDANVTAFQAATALFSAQVKGKTTVRELADNVGAVAPIAHAAGVGMDELVATLSTLTLGGLKTDMAATALRGALNALVKPQQRASKIMSAMGIIYGGANIKAQGLTASFRSLKDALKKYGIDAVAQAIPNIRAFTAVTAMTEEQLQMVDTIMMKIASDRISGDGLVRAEIDMARTLGNTWSRVYGNMLVVFDRFTRIFENDLKGAALILEKFMFWLADMPPAWKKIIVIVLAAMAVLGPLLITLGILGSIFPGLTIALGWFGVASAAAFAPWIAGAVGIVAVASALGQVYTNWDRLTADGFFKDFMGFVFGVGEKKMYETLNNAQTYGMRKTDSQGSLEKDETGSGFMGRLKFIAKMANPNLASQVIRGIKGSIGETPAEQKVFGPRSNERTLIDLKVTNKVPNAKVELDETIQRVGDNISYLYNR